MIDKVSEWHNACTLKSAEKATKFVYTSGCVNKMRRLRPKGLLCRVATCNVDIEYY